MLRVLLLFICFIKITYQGSINTQSFQTLSRPKRQYENKCVLPDHPANGELKLFGQENDPYLPNSFVILNTIIDLSCKNGTVTETGGPSRAICYQGKWTPSLSRMEGCVRSCPKVNTEGENQSLICTHKNSRINCNNPIESTVIQIVCKPFYEYVGLHPYVTCRDGSWDNVISPCQPECGKKRVSAQSLIIGGSTAAKLEYPWVAGIYTSKNTQYLGGATVISRYFVLSAAHMFTTREGDVLDKNNYIVTVGKYYRDFDDKRDINMQSSRIKRVYISENFGGQIQNYVGDLAILTLEDPFTITEYVQPVCIDWENLHESSALNEDNKGIIAGWGFMQNDNLAEELQELDVPYKSKDTCSVSQEFKSRYFTYDKFCAGYTDNQTSVCLGDGGGGLVFRNSEGKFFIRGILSVAPIKAGHCNTNTPALYTRISTYLPEIQKETRERILKK